VLCVVHSGMREGGGVMDRAEASRALAKAIAYVNCGKPELAADWLGELIASFQNEGVVLLPRHLSDEPVPSGDMRAASAWLGGKLIKREGSVQL
jgi:hypothetical protein